MKLKSVSLALATTALVALTLPVLAQDKSGMNVRATAEGAASGGPATMNLAQELYALGVAQGDALTVLAAAKLAASVEVTEGTAGKLDPATIIFEEDDLLKRGAFPAGAPKLPEAMMADAGRTASVVTLSKITSEDNGASDAPVTADAMFAKALELAAGDEALVGLIEDAMAEGSRGRIGGAVEWLSRLPAGQTDVWEIPFYGNSYAEIAVAGDGDADLDVAVTDENGNVICYDVSWSDRIYCDWTPSWDGYFYVTVQNMGSSRNSYYLLTN
ncbi:hypothetical protein MCELHM10_00303 [Paracoccaceae bacterium]